MTNDADDGWEWDEPTDESLAEELLEPYRALAKPGHPFAPMARRILELGPSYETYELMREAMLAWPDSTLAALDELETYLQSGEEDPVSRGRIRIMKEFLRLRFPDPLHPGRRRELESLGYEADLDNPAAWAAMAEAAIRTADARDPAGLPPEEIRALYPHVERAFKNHLNETVTDSVAPGERSARRRRKQMVPLEEYHGAVEPGVSPDLLEREFRKMEELAALSRTEVSIMERLVLGGQTASEIAQSDGRSESTVRVHIHNAKAKLRTLVERIA